MTYKQMEEMEKSFNPKTQFCFARSDVSQEWYYCTESQFLQIMGMEYKIVSKTDTKTIKELGYELESKEYLDYMRDLFGSDAAISELKRV